MSNTKPFCLSVCELGSTGSSDRRRVMPPNYLHYCPPSAGGWGIIRVGLLVPESVMLFVSPAGCGRHGAIAGIQLGFKKRLFFLHISELDIVTGQHLEKVFQAVAEILAEIRPRPKAMTICATCIDDLLGSDYDAIARELESKHKIPVRACHMDPIAMDGKTPPPFTVQQAVYDFIPRSEKKEPTVNIIGSFAPFAQDSEFYEIMSAAGIEKVRHIAACSTLEEFYQMGRAKHNILVKPGGRLAVRAMEKKLGIPYCFAPVAYGIDTIGRNYRILEKLLNIQLSTKRYCEEARETASHYRKVMGSLTVAVGETANASPFEMARALIGYGFQVPYVFADMTLDIDQEHIEWLKSFAPYIRVFTNVHPTMADFLQQKLTVDLAVGFDAGYFCSGAKTLPLSLDKQLYGYRGVVSFFRQMLDALENPQNHREQMYASGMVI